MSRHHWMAPVFIAPIVLLLLVFVAYPVFHNFWVSFHEMGLFGQEAKFVGLRNFIELSSDSRFLHALTIDVIWTIATVGLQLIVGTVAALVLHRHFFGRGLARSLVLIPYLTPPVIVAVMWRWMLHGSLGIVKHVLRSLNIISVPIAFLGTPTLALVSLILIGVWQWSPFVTISVLARLQTIPPELPEAARIDGANPWQALLHVTLPQLRSVFFVIILLRGVWMFNKFDLPWALTGGGPARSTEILPVLAYLKTFSQGQVGMGTAINVICFVLLGLLALVYFYVYDVEEEM